MYAARSILVHSEPKRNIPPLVLKLYSQVNFEAVELTTDEGN